MGVKIKQSFIGCFHQHSYVTTSGNFRTIAMRNAMEEIGTDRVLFSIEKDRPPQRRATLQSAQ
jgi:gamma-resorcylate decarboxylase